MFDRSKELKLKAAQATEQKIRASLRAKMIEAGPDQITEVTAQEFAYTLSGDMDSLVREVDDYRAQQRESGLQQMAGGPSYAHPSVTLDAADQDGFEEAARPLIKYLARNHNPHTHVIVNNNSAEMVQGFRSFNTAEYIGN